MQANFSLDPPAASPTVYGSTDRFAALRLRRGSASGGCGSVREPSLLPMAKRIIFICVWTFVFSFGSAFIMGFGLGVYFGLGGARPNDQTSLWAGAALVILPLLVFGPLGLVLGLLGRLPGTRRKT